MIKSIAIFCVMFCVMPALASAAGNQTAEQYISEFYYRYSHHFDEFGMTYSVPRYGIADFKAATTTRELMSLASYYHFRALAGETLAQDIVVGAIRQSDAIYGLRSPKSYSFEDAAAQFLMWRMLDAFPNNLVPGESWNYKLRIINRAKDSLNAPDTENRAVLSAAYWQFMANEAGKAGLIGSAEKAKLDILIKAKIDLALALGVDKDGWYSEGDPSTFNPHYHLVTAFYTMAYGDLTGSDAYISLAKRMANNLRQLSFANGMVEADLGPRPAGLGAQFYLGAGLLNWRTGFSDYGAYLEFARGNRFFSDGRFPNRLEYHATLEGRQPDFHDDYAFSNLAEMALSLPFFSSEPIEFRNSLNLKSDSSGIANDGRNIVYGGVRYSQLSDGSRSRSVKDAPPRKSGIFLLGNILLNQFYLRNSYNNVLKL